MSAANHNTIMQAIFDLGNVSCDVSVVITSARKHSDHNLEGALHHLHHAEQFLRAFISDNQDKE